MQNDIINLQPGIYYKNLEIINSVEFTPREIDIIACLLSGRKHKMIFAPLPIVTRAVETNVKNMRRKLNDVKGGIAYNHIADTMRHCFPLSVVTYV